MSAATFSTVRNQVDAQHVAEFDNKMAGLDSAKQGAILTWIQQLIALLQSMGQTVNWGCIWAEWQQIVAAATASLSGDFSLWPGVLVGYLTCAHPTPAPVP